MILKLAATILFIASTSHTQSSIVRPLVIRNVTVIDMAGARPKRGVTVLIVNGKISKIGKNIKKTVLDPLLVDGTSKFLIPALWDMHVHVLNSDLMLPLFVANGVLGVRDLGTHDLNDVLLWRKQSADGAILSPRVVTAGKVIDGFPQADASFSLLAKTPEEGRLIARQLKAKGVDCLKVYDNLTRDTYFAIVDESKKLGLPFVGHVPAPITSIEASDSGQRSIEHLGKILEDSSAAPEKIASIRSEKIEDGDYFAFTSRIGRSYDEIISTFDQAREDEIIRHFVKNSTWQVPTLSTKYGRTFIDLLDAKGDPRARYVEPSQVNYWKPQVGFFSRYRSPGYIAAQKRYFAKEQELVGRLQKKGVKLMAGTDAPNAYVIAGFGLHDELVRLVESGLTPMQALLTATRNPAEYLGELSNHGTIEPGKAADLILLDANPLTDISNTARIFAVIQQGRLLTRRDLDAVLENVEAAAKIKKN